MIRWLLRYGIVVFIFNTIILNIATLHALGDNFFLLLMGFFSFIFLINPRQLKLVLFHRAFLIFLIFNIVNLFYFLLFHNFSDYQAIEYLLARFIQFLLIIFSVFYNYTYFVKYFCKHITYAILCVVFLGFFFGGNLDSSVIGNSIFSGRWDGIVWNPNQLANFTCIAFAALLLGSNKIKNIDVFFLFVLLVVSLLTGSRTVIVAVPLALLLKYGFSKVNLFFTFFSIFFYLLIYNLDLNTGIHRFANQSLLSDRILQYKYAYITLMENPLIGYGLNNYAYIDSALTPYQLKKNNIISAHNGYLALLVQYGLIFGSIFLGVLFFYITKIFINIKMYKNHLFYIFILLFTLISSIYESLITGINSFHTTLFFLSLAVLTYSKYLNPNEN